MYSTCYNKLSTDKGKGQERNAVTAKAMNPDQLGYIEKRITNLTGTTDSGASQSTRKKEGES